ncbi:hypothetical protein ACIQ2D_11770 [Lysinibacillus sp. NPDC097287]|uniref:hypothetical protein n=1 Tax=Lysinibacillus sp. NPDC097287 TaxID=3364144 RepID=UPI0038132665
MKKRLGCLHAHHSNIAYIETALAMHEVELVHYVDSGLMYKMMQDEQFHEVDALVKVKEHLEWIASCDVDAILITCTNMIAVLKDEYLILEIPIIKIDEPYFEVICCEPQPQTLLFTNPATVTGTIERLQQYAKYHEKKINIKIHVIENSFELLMQGKKEAYNKAILQFLHESVHERSIISVAQLSMVDAAQQFSNASGISVTHPLKSLVTAILLEMDGQYFDTIKL